MTNTHITTTTQKTSHHFGAVLLALVAMALAVLLAGGTALAANTTLHSNLSPIQIADNGPANPYPSHINVQDLGGNITDVNVALFGYGHTFPDDVGVLLVGPQGQKALLMSDVGGSNDVNDVGVGFDDESSISLPDEGQITDTQYKPTQGTSPTDPGHVVQPTFPSPAPAGPYATSLSAFDGTNPNGIWDLYIVDDSGQDVGQVAGGWSLFITTDGPPDTTSPRVESTVPQSGATGISPSANVKAAFSEGMTISTVNATTFKLFKKGSTTKVAATVTYDGAADNSTAKLDPANPLKRGATYKAVVTTGAKDQVGNRLDQNPNLSGLQSKVWTFKVSN
jgi:subtilisin-like proprotein convertase family protein